MQGRLAVGVCGDAPPVHCIPVYSPHKMSGKTRWEPSGHLGPRWGIARCGKSNAAHSVADSCTGIGVVAGCAVVVLLRYGPHGKQGDARWRIQVR